MATVTVPCATLYPDITATVLTDQVTGLPTAVVIQPGAATGVAWAISFKGATISGSAAAGGLAQTVPLVGAALGTDLQTVTLGPHLTVGGVTIGAHPAARSR